MGDAPEMSGVAVAIGHDGDVDNVRNIGDRLDHVVAQQLGPPPARLDPSEPVDWDAEERRTWDEWWAAKARALVSRLDDQYQGAVPRHGKSARWLELYREGRKVNYLIHGTVGTGKTWELCGVLRRLLTEDYVPALMIGIPELVKRLKPAPGKQGLDAELRSFQEAPVLGLDDLGVELPLLPENLRSWWSSTLYLLTDYRARHQLPTIFTSNLNPTQLGKAYDDRVFRRMFEGAGRLEITERPPEAPRAFGTKL